MGSRRLDRFSRSLLDLCCRLWHVYLRLDAGIRPPSIS